jgi:hypothetical protein
MIDTRALVCCAFVALATANARAQSPVPTPAPSAVASPAPSAPASPAAGAAASPSIEDAVPNAYVHGQVLTIGHGFLVFTTGEALRVRKGTVVPNGTTTGSLVRVTIDQLTREVKAVELEPRIALQGEVDAASLAREYVVRSPGSAPKPEAAGAPAAASGQLVSVTLTVSVPGNTPLGDDIYLSTERSAYNASEIRLQQVDAHHFTTGLSLPLGSRLRYQYTRGSNATVERDRAGDIAQPHEFTVSPNAKIEDTVARWADLN